MPRKFCFLLFCLTTSLSCLSVHAQRDRPTTRILFVFDASNSMNAEWEGTPKIDVARDLLSQTLDSLKGSSKLELGLRVYGHQYHVSSRQKNCNDTKLEVPFGPSTTEEIMKTIKKVEPKGTTPIARSIGKAASDFTDCKNCRNIIILITDGLEACGGNPCDVSHKLQEKGVVLKPFVIGVGLDEKMIEKFQCIGKFYDASNKKDFRKVLNVVISQALNSTTAQVNLLNIHDRPKETNVPLTFYDRNSGRKVREFVHTMNHYGLPDTIRIDPLMTYRVVAHTTPPVTNDSVTITPGQHNIIPLKTPQGKLNVRFKEGAKDLEGIDVLVKQKGKEEILQVQSMNKVRSYLVGDYHLEVLTLPRLEIGDVHVSQNHTTKVEVPIPGQLLIKFSSPGPAAIFHKENGERKKVTDLQKGREQIQVRLLPGDYTVVYRPAPSKRSFYSKKKEFTIESSHTTKVEF
ncbi:MAG: VWA domain-containing protein [Flavobacteriales bacterium]